MLIKGKEFKSKTTDKVGTIDRIVKDQLYLKFDDGEITSIDLVKYKELIEVDKETRRELNAIIRIMYPEQTKKIKSNNLFNDFEVLPKKYDELVVGNEELSFKLNVDVLNACFGTNKKVYNSSTYPKTLDLFVKGERKNAFVWFVKSFKSDDCWKLSISDDEEYFYEIANYKRREDFGTNNNTTIGKYRLIFLKEKEDGLYHFMGLYEDYQMEDFKHIYRRISKHLKLIGNPVYEIEIL